MDEQTNTIDFGYREEIGDDVGPKTQRIRVFSSGARRAACFAIGKAARYLCFAPSLSPQARDIPVARPFNFFICKRFSAKNRAAITGLRGQILHVVRFQQTSQIGISEFDSHAPMPRHYLAQLFDIHRRNNDGNEVAHYPVRTPASERIKA